MLTSTRARCPKKLACPIRQGRLRATFEGSARLSGRIAHARAKARDAAQMKPTRARWQGKRQIREDTR